MSQSLAKIIIHLIFSTKNRVPFLTINSIRNEMHRYLGGTLKRLQCPVLTIGGTSDHVHILFSLNRQESIARVVQEIKRESSKWIKTKDLKFRKFKWQTGYGAFSVSQSQIIRIKKYISNQEVHHKSKRYEEEYIAFLDKYEIPYDARFVFD
jgi:putative transposase